MQVLTKSGSWLDYDKRVLMSCLRQLRENWRAKSLGGTICIRANGSTSKRPQCKSKVWLKTHVNKTTLWSHTLMLGIHSPRFVCACLELCKLACCMHKYTHLMSILHGIQTRIQNILLCSKLLCCNLSLILTIHFRISQNSWDELIS